MLNEGFEVMFDVIFDVDLCRVVGKISAGQRLHLKPSAALIKRASAFSKVLSFLELLFASIALLDDLLVSLLLK